MTMNRYGLAALAYWRQSLPRDYRAIPDPMAFFTHLGEKAERQAGELWDEMVLAGPPADGESDEQRAQRLARFKEEAEEAVLDELVRPPRGPAPDAVTGVRGAQDASMPAGPA